MKLPRSSPPRRPATNSTSRSNSDISSDFSLPLANTLWRNYPEIQETIIGDWNESTKDRPIPISPTRVSQHFKRQTRRSRGGSQQRQYEAEVEIKRSTSPSDPRYQSQMRGSQSRLDQIRAMETKRSGQTLLVMAKEQPTSDSVCPD
jgi:hypothetical protein